MAPITQNTYSLHDRMRAPEIADGPATEAELRNAAAQMRQIDPLMWARSKVRTVESQLAQNRLELEVLQKANIKNPKRGALEEFVPQQERELQQAKKELARLEGKGAGGHASGDAGCGCVVM
jgi:hypothetical protein